MNEPPSIQSLVDRALSGSDADWFTLVDRFSPMIWSICRVSGLSQSDGEDVAQVVFTKLVTHLQGIRNAEAVPKWVIITTKREAWRTKALSRRSVQGSDQLLESDDDEDLEQRELEKQEVREALLKVNPRCRELLVALFGDQDVTYDQAADRLGLKPNSIGATRKRCLESLLEKLGE